MLNFQCFLKCISLVPTVPFTIISKSGFSLFSKKNLSSTMASVQLKNRGTYHIILNLIEDYFKSNHSKNKFNALLLWQSIDFENSLPTLDFLINNDRLLLSIFEDSSDIIRASKHKVSAKSLCLICDPLSRSILLERLGSKGLLKAMSHDSSFSNLMFLLDTDNWDRLLKRISVADIIKICNSNAFKYVLEIVLDDSRWFHLKTKLGVENFVKIGRYDGARNVFSILEDPKTWHTLICRVGKENLVAIATKNGSRGMLDIILDTKKWSKLLSKLDIDVILNILRTGNKRLVLEFFLDDKKCKQLFDHFDSDLLMNVIFKNGSKTLLDYMCSPSRWELISNRLGSSTAFSIAKNPGATKLFDIVSDNSKWFRLCELFSSDSIIKLSKYMGSHMVFDIFLDSVSFSVLESRLSRKEIVKLSSFNSAKFILYLVLDDTSWSKLEERLGKVVFINLASHTGAHSIINFVLDDDKWSILYDALGESTLLRLLLKPSFSLRLSQISSNLMSISDLLGKNMLASFVFIHPIDQKGLSRDCLIQLSSLGFKISEILCLTKLSGRFFSYYLGVLNSNASTLSDLFSSFNLQTLNFVNSIQYNLVTRTPVCCDSAEKYWFFYLCAVNRYCYSTPLLLEDLSFLKHQNLPYTMLFHLLSLTSSFIPSDRSLTWESFISKPWFKEGNWTSLLIRLPLQIRQWFICEGIEFVDKIVGNSFSSFCPDIDLNNLIICIQHFNLRQYLLEKYDKPLSLNRKCLNSFSLLKLSDFEYKLCGSGSYTFSILDWFTISIDFYEFLHNHSYQSPSLSFCDFLSSTELELFFFSTPYISYSYGYIFIFQGDKNSKSVSNGSRKRLCNDGSLLPDSKHMRFSGDDFVFDMSLFSDDSFLDAVISDDTLLDAVVSDETLLDDRCL